MPNRIEVALRQGVRDARGERIAREIEHFLKIGVSSVRTVDVYTVDAELPESLLQSVAAGPFSDPVMQTWQIDSPVATDFDFLVEVGFRPGVTDNVGRTAREAIEYITGRPFRAGEGVFTSVQYLFSGCLSLEDTKRIATEILCNTLIQRFQILDSESYFKQGGISPNVPRVIGENRGMVCEIDLE